MVATIKEVVRDSIAEELGIEPGDKLLKINNIKINDIIDYQFYSEEEFLDIMVQKTNNEIWKIEIEKDYDEDVGIIFDGIVFDNIKSCKNRCVFCFIDQMPPNMRKTLYIKDDDYRYSFLYGNFITLTNLGEEDWQKIVNLRLSPLYVSVHSTNGKVRQEMLNNKNAASIKEDLQRLKDVGLEVHTQIVLCPEINDDIILVETLNDLIALYPSVLSIGIVPVGLTGFRDKLKTIKPVSSQQASELIDLINDYQILCRQKYDKGLIYLADEFYVKAKRDFPEADYYDDYCQIENGIGLARLLLDEFEELQEELPHKIEPREVYLVTGYSAMPVLQPIVDRLNQIENLYLQLVPVKNNYFNGEVTVTGLLTGSDILNILKNGYKDKRVIIPEVVFKEGQDLFLDNISLEDIKKISKANITTVDGSAEDLIKAILR